MTDYFNNVYIKSKFTIIHNDNNPRTLKEADYVIKDFCEKDLSFEESESILFNKSINGLIKKSGIKKVDLIIGSDLQNQLLSSHYGVYKLNTPFLGVYSACASFAEQLIIGSNILEHNNKNIILTVSSHNLVNEKQFRFPIEYGAQRKKVNSLSSTGAASVLLSNKGKIKIESTTIGKVIDSKLKDANDMGSCMSISACDTLYEHLKDTGRDFSYYDLILTGDLGKYGLQTLKDYYKHLYNEEINNIEDAGSLLYSNNKDFPFAGGSSPICLPVVLLDYILKKKYKKILIIATGCLHSQVSCSQGLNILSIAHAVSLEVKK